MAVTINASTSTGLVQSADTSGEIELQSNGTTALKVNTNEGIQILNCLGVGNATPSTSGAGITFPATQSASTDANTLDDYEEGTFTPQGNGITFSSASGTYTKIGRIVTVTYDVTFPSTSNTGQARIANLPFTPSVGGGGSIGYCEETTVTRTVNDSNTFLYLYNGSNAIVTNATCSTDRIWGTHTYIV